MAVLGGAQYEYALAGSQCEDVTLDGSYYGFRGRYLIIMGSPWELFANV